jgi:hypothetical protein
MHFLPCVINWKSWYFFHHSLRHNLLLLIALSFGFISISSLEWNSGIKMGLVCYPEPRDSPIISSHLNHIKLCVNNFSMKDFWLSQDLGG